MSAKAEAAALSAVEERFGLTDAGAIALARFLAIIADDPAAPTTVRAPEAAIDVHLADSLVALELPAVRAARTLADLGAGVGMPGLALAAALPAAVATLVESAARKCAFLRRAAAAMALGDRVEVVCARAEAWAGGHAAHDVVTARAVAALPVLVEYAAPLLRPGGSLVAWKGAVEAEEEADGEAAAAHLGLEPHGYRAVEPYPTARGRRLYVYVKIGPTPNGYPRRPGMARKRPLRATR